MLFVGLPLGLFSVLLLFFTIFQKKNSNSQSATLKKFLSEKSGKTKTSDAFYQRVYVKIESLPIVNRYMRKIRRRLELINQEDEYTIRKETGRITLKGILLTLIASIIISYINR